MNNTHSNLIIEMNLNIENNLNIEKDFNVEHNDTILQNSINNSINTIKSIENNHFIKFYMINFYDLLGVRRESFLTIFKLLIKKNKVSYNIVETGCMRKVTDCDDGLSTLLFDYFVKYFSGSVTTVDLSKENCELCASYVSNKCSIYNMDSVEFLYKYKPVEDIDLLYLDSYDLDWNNPIPSALHHMKELCAIIPKLRKGCIILIDDNNKNIGKGQFVANFLDNIGAKQLFSEYQIAYEL
tara:strand:+ start:1500 stop:2219 length:720 start_codon:yes stop_codon:yes gene_type:complete